MTIDSLGSLRAIARTVYRANYLDYMILRLLAGNDNSWSPSPPGQGA